jgi:hypothetical protein
LSILMVSAERRFVIAVGSGKPVSAATRWCLIVVVVTGAVVDVVDDDVVVEESATATVDTPRHIAKVAPSERTIRRTTANYLIATPVAFNADNLASSL